MGQHRSHPSVVATGCAVGVRWRFDRLGGFRTDHAGGHSTAADAAAAGARGRGSALHRQQRAAGEGLAGGWRRLLFQVLRHPALRGAEAGHLQRALAAGGAAPAAGRRHRWAAIAIAERAGRDAVHDAGPAVRRGEQHPLPDPRADQPGGVFGGLEPQSDRGGGAAGVRAAAANIEAAVGGACCC